MGDDGWGRGVRDVDAKNDISDAKEGREEGFHQGHDGICFRDLWITLFVCYILVLPTLLFPTFLLVTCSDSWRRRAQPGLRARLQEWNGVHLQLTLLLAKSAKKSRSALGWGWHGFEERSVSMIQCFHDSGMQEWIALWDASSYERTFRLTLSRVPNCLSGIQSCKALLFLRAGGRVGEKVVSKWQVERERRVPVPSAKG
ncbi:hypothetical protein BT69DRAFT_455788 [Atractiella rhizophila]|nr:hypothetical protein BT69DRAFT_455788 [Atractiella rhizophila]